MADLQYYGSYRPGQTVFVIASDYRNIAIFKPSALREIKGIVPVDVVWYSVKHDTKLIRVTGNVWRYNAWLENNKFIFHKK